MQITGDCSRKCTSTCVSGVANSSLAVPHGKAPLRSSGPGDRAGEAGAEQVGGRLFAGVSHLGRQGSSVGAGAEQGGSSLFLRVAVAAEPGGGCGSLPPRLP